MAHSRRKLLSWGVFCLRRPAFVVTVERLGIDLFPGNIRDSRESEAEAGS